ncbi:MAG: DUF6807 family protein [Thermoguttaceae bacterium]
MPCILTLVLSACVAQAVASSGPFAFKEISPTGLQLSDGGQPVFVYNFGMLSSKGQPASMARSSYLHPVYAPDGTMVTDDFNPNHPHHRGIFWAWPEVSVDGKKGDMWTIKGPFQDRFVAWRARETAGGEARLAVENGWFDGDRKIVKENVTIIAHAVVDNRRALDFTLQFEATDRPAQIAGTPEGKKGFGGFCLRFATPDCGGAKTVIRTERGISAKDGVMARHTWAEISGVYKGKPAGARVEDDPANPGQPNNGWLMRHELCCLNVSYPGMTPITLEPGKPLVLKYHVVLFAGKSGK